MTFFSTPSPSALASKGDKMVAQQWSAQIEGECSPRFVLRLCLCWVAELLYSRVLIFRARHLFLLLSLKRDCAITVTLCSRKCANDESRCRWQWKNIFIVYLHRCKRWKINAIHVLNQTNIIGVNYSFYFLCMNVFSMHICEATSWLLFFPYATH